MNDFQKFLDQSLSKINLNTETDNEIEKIEYDIYKIIREQIIAIRKENKLTQKDLSQKTGLSQANISNIEKGISCPTIETLKKIANATGKRLIIEYQDDEGGCIMPTISEINIKKFRGIKDLEIHSLNRVNLIVGDNNSGKTSVLEALQLFRTSSNLANLYSIARQREAIFGLNSNSIYENFICMFPHDGSDLSIEVNGVCFESHISFQLSGNQKRVLIDAKDLNRNFLVHNEDLNGELETDVFEGNIDFEYGELKVHSTIGINRFSRISGTLNNSKDVFKIIYVSPFEHLKGNTISLILKNDEYKEICLKALQLFDSEIEDILILRSDIGNRPVEYLKHSRLGIMPLSTFGDGIKKVLVLSNAIARAAGGILLVDEIETAIHKKYYDDIFSFIVKACRAFDVQIFISTHSIEAIDGLLATQRYDESNTDYYSRDDIQVITLKKENGRTYSRSLTGKEVYTNRETFGFEGSSMKKLILCEGVTDAILLSYYLEKVAGWTYCKAPKDLPIKEDRENESVNWYKKDNDFLLICGVGGKDNFSHFFNSKIKPPLFLTNAFERIAVVTDRDKRKINEIEQEMKESFIDNLNVQHNQWCESHYIDSFGFEKKIDFLLVVIPNDCQGALETVMLEAISENPYDKNIVNKVKIFLKQIRDEASKYISSSRLELKAYLGVTWAIQYPEKVFSLIDQQIKSVNWEKSQIINTCFAELKNI